MTTLDSFFTAFVRLYQLTLSPLFHLCGCRCKYTISCSSYAILSIKTYGWKKGIILAIRRLSTCW